jgi:gas vesicle protein
MSTGKALLGVLAGIAAGAAIGVIFAPDKGSNTRKNISKKGEDLAKALSDKVDARFEGLMNAAIGKSRKVDIKNGEAAARTEAVS